MTCFDTNTISKKNRSIYYSPAYMPHKLVFVWNFSFKIVNISMETIAISEIYSVNIENHYPWYRWLTTRVILKDTRRSSPYKRLDMGRLHDGQWFLCYFQLAWFSSFLYSTQKIIYFIHKAMISLQIFDNAIAVDKKEKFIFYTIRSQLENFFQNSRFCGMIL